MHNFEETLVSCIISTTNVNGQYIFVFIQKQVILILFIFSTKYVNLLDSLISGIFPTIDEAFWRIPNTLFVSNKLMSSFYKSNVVFIQVKGCLYTSQMSSLYKSNVVFVQVKCCLYTSERLSLYKSNVVFVQVKCCLYTSERSFLYKSNVVFVQIKCCHYKVKCCLC